MHFIGTIGYRHFSIQTGNSMSETSEIQRKSLLNAVLGAAASVERVEIQQIDLPPGRAVGLHRHACPVVGYVVSGAINFQIEGEPTQRLRSGDAFFEPSGTLIAHFDNASSRTGATFIAFYLLASGQRELIEMIKQPKVGT
jgi:quercetin dioxygenase-like cupin family protein